MCSLLSRALKSFLRLAELKNQSVETKIKLQHNEDLKEKDLSDKFNIHNKDTNLGLFLTTFKINYNSIFTVLAFDLYTHSILHHYNTPPVHIIDSLTSQPDYRCFTRFNYYLKLYANRDFVQFMHVPPFKIVHHSVHCSAKWELVSNTQTV